MNAKIYSISHTTTICLGEFHQILIRESFLVHHVDLSVRQAHLVAVLLVDYGDFPATVLGEDVGVDSETGIGGELLN